MCTHIPTFTQNSDTLTSTKWMLLHINFINSIAVIYLTSGGSSSRRQREEKGESDAKSFFLLVFLSHNSYLIAQACTWEWPYASLHLYPVHYQILLALPLNYISQSLLSIAPATSVAKVTISCIKNYNSHLIGPLTFTLASCPIVRFPCSSQNFLSKVKSYHAILLLKIINCLTS